MFVLLCVYLSGMIGCATKESGAEKVSNDTQILANKKPNTDKRIVAQKVNNKP